MATSLTDFTNLDVTGARDWCDEHPDVIRALQGLAAVWVGKVFTGTEPNDQLDGFNFTDNWKIEAASGTIDFDEGGVRRFAVNTASVIADVALQVPDGSAAAPGLRFTGDTTAGWSFPSSNITASISGAEVASFRSATSTMQFGTGWSITAEDGAVGAPAYGFRTAPTGSGMYLDSSNRVAFAVDGVDEFRISPTVSEFLGSVQVPASGATTPTVNFTGATTHGLASDGSEVAIVVGGTAVFRCFSTVVSTPLIFRTDDGLEAFPAHSFSADANTGAWNPTADNYAIATGGTERVRWSSAGQTLTVPILTAFGTAGAPTFTSSSDSTTGMYVASAGNLGFSAGGVEQVLITSAGVTIGDGGTISGDATGGVGGGPTVEVSVGGNVIAAPGCPPAQSTTFATQYPGSHVNLVGAGTSNSIPAGSQATSSTYPAVSRVAGDVALPAFAHEDDLVTGLSWTAGAGTLSFIVGGVESMRLQAFSPAGNHLSTLQVPGGWWYSGDPVRCGLAGYGDLDTGFFWGNTHAGGSANQLYPCAGGDIMATFAADGIYMTGYTGADFGTSFVSQLHLDSGDGVANPGLTWDGSSNTGIYQNAANNIQFGTSGTERARILSTGFRVTSSSSTATPPISFISHTDVGLAVNTSGNNDYLSLVAQGQEVLRVNGNATDTEHQILVGADANIDNNSRPSIAGVGDQNTGISWGPTANASKYIKVVVRGGLLGEFQQNGEIDHQTIRRTRVLATNDTVDSTPAAITWDSAEYNQATDDLAGTSRAHWDSGTNPSRLTAYADGQYYVAFSAFADVSAVGAATMQGFVRIDGTTDSGIGQTGRVVAADDDLRIAASDMIELTDGQYVELVLSTTSATLTTVVDSWFTLVRVNATV